MRRTVTAIAILVISALIGIFSYIYVKDACTKALNGIEEIVNAALTDDVEAVNHLCVQANTDWAEKVFLLNILIGREYTQGVSKRLSQMECFSGLADYDSVITNAQECKAELLHIIRSNEPELSTIL